MTDWRGEHLIRSVKKAHPGKQGWGDEEPARKKRDNGPRPICAVPSCERKLTGSNTVGVCRTHNHARGYCRCLNCRRRQ